MAFLKKNLQNAIKAFFKSENEQVDVAEKMYPKFLSMSKIHGVTFKLDNLFVRVVLDKKKNRIIYKYKKYRQSEY